MDKVIVMNHKMGLLYVDLSHYIDGINGIEKDVNIIVCPSDIYLESFINNGYYAVGAQNVSFYEDINHTGYISTDMLKSLGAEYVIVGHREAGDSVEVIKKKFNACLDANLIPILCIQSEDDLHLLKGVHHIEFIVFDYEPENGFNEEELRHIYGKLKDEYGVKPTIIYGGNVNVDNINDYMKNEYLSGVLLGSMSSDIDKVRDIIDMIE